MPRTLREQGHTDCRWIRYREEFHHQRLCQRYLWEWRRDVKANIYCRTQYGKTARINLVWNGDSTKSCQSDAQAQPIGTSCAGDWWFTGPFGEQRIRQSIHTHQHIKCTNQRGSRKSCSHTHERFLPEEHRKASDRRASWYHKDWRTGYGYTWKCHTIT